MKNKAKITHSIFTDDLTECPYTGSHDVEIHHVFGGANRNRSTKYGFVVPLDKRIHPNGAFFNEKFCLDYMGFTRKQWDYYLKAKCEKYYLDNKLGRQKDFLNEFGRNYIQMYYCNECCQVIDHLEERTDYKWASRHGHDIEQPFTYLACPECGSDEVTHITDVQAELLANYKVGDEVRLIYEGDNYIGHIRSIDIDNVELEEHELDFDMRYIEDVKAIYLDYKGRH